MPDSSIKDGWQRFLDRLRRLWGRLRPGEFANGPTVNMGGGCAFRAPRWTQWFRGLAPVYTCVRQRTESAVDFAQNGYTERRR